MELGYIDMLLIMVGHNIYPNYFNNSHKIWSSLDGRQEQKIF